MSDLPEGFQPEEEQLPEGFLPEEEQPAFKYAPAPLERAPSIPGAEPIGGISPVQGIARAGGELARTVGQLVSPSTYLPEQEVPKPFVIGGWGGAPGPAEIRQMTIPEARARSPLYSPEVPLLPVRGTQLQPTGSDAERQLASLSTLDNIALIAGGAESEVLGMAMLADMAPQAYQAVKNIARSDVSPEDKRDQINSLVMPLAIGLRHMKPEAPPIEPIAPRAPAQAVRTVEPPAPPVTPSPTVQPLPAETGAPVPVPEVASLGPAKAGGKDPFGNPLGTKYHATPEDWAKWKAVQEQAATAKAAKDFTAMAVVGKETEALKAKYAGAVPQPPKLAPDDLQPALLVDNKPVTGGDTHEEIFRNATEKETNPDVIADIIDAQGDDARHVFVDKNGTVYTRKEASISLGEKDPLKSERLLELKKKPAPAVAPAAAPAPAAPTYTGVDAQVVAGKPLGEWFTVKDAKELPKGEARALLARTIKVANQPAKILSALKNEQERIRKRVGEIYAPPAPEVAPVTPATPAAPVAPATTPKELALEAQRAAGWDPKWPFVPADFQNKSFRDALEADPTVNKADKDRMFAAAEKLLGGKIDRSPAAPAAAPAPAPAPAPEKFPNTGVGAPADAFGAIYGPKLTPDQITRFKDQEGEQFDIPSEGGFTTTLKVKRNMLWMETSQKVPGTTSTYDVGVAYMHIRPDGTTVLDASKHGRPIDKAAAASLMRFLQRTGEKEATPTPPAALPPTPPVPAAPSVKLSESDMRDLVSDLTQLSRRSDLDVEERANVARAIEAARMGNPTEGLALRDRLKELAVPKTKLVKGIKFGGTGERIPDLIDWLKDAFPSGVKITSKSDYGRLVDEATGAAREVLFKNKGASVDTVMKAAELEGMQFGSQDDFINAVLKAGSGRTETGARLSAEERMLQEEAAQVEEFQATALRNRGRTPAEKKAATPVPVENLKVGDKFTIKGEQFTVSEVTPEGDVITDDGKRFGRQALRDGQTIHPDRGEVIGEPEAAEEPAPTPKERVKEEVQKVQDYAAGMVQSAGVYIRRSIDAGRTPEQAGLDWAREIGMGMMDVPDDIYLRERGGLYTSTYVKGILTSKEGVALNAKEYLKAVDEGRQEGKSRIGMGAAVRSEAKATGPRGEDLPTYGVAARVLEKQRQAGTIIPVEPGEGVSPEEQIQRGRDLLAAGANAENIMAEMERTKKFNADEAAILRAHGELLDQAFFAASDKFGPNSPVAEKALEDYSAWQKRFKNLSTEWHRTGQTLQGETEIDTGTFHGLRKAWIDATGKDFTPEQAQEAKKKAKAVKDATEQADKAKADTLAEVGKSAATETGKRPAAPKPGEVAVPDAPTIWKRAKELLDAGEDDFDSLRHKLAQEFGIPVEEVYRKLTEPKAVRTISDDMYRKMANRRRLVNDAKDWLRNEQSPGWLQFTRKVPRVFFTAKILGHGTVGMITHAGLNIFNPGAWRTYWPNFFRQYRLLASKAYHERTMQDLLRDPLFTKARRAGLANDPFRVSDDYQNPTFVKWLDRIGLTGGRGFDALKTFRQARFNQIWNSLPESLQTPGYAKLLADGINHATGAIRRPFREWANWTFFAPRLEASRWAWMVKDPWDAAKTFVDWEKATPEARAFAMSQLKEKAAIAGTYYGLLMMNQGLLEASGSDQRINFTNPRRGDFLAFKAAGHNIGIVGPMLGMVRLFANLYHAAAGKRGKVESLTPRAAEFGQIGLEYARGKLSPFAGFGMDVISQADFQGRPMPFSSDKTPKYLRRQGLGPYTYGEYAAQGFTPIPISEAVREVWRDQGMGDEQIEAWRKALLVGVAAGMTGARVSAESPPSPTK